MRTEEQRIQLWKHTGYTMLIFLMLLEWLVPLRELKYELNLFSLVPLLVVIGCSLLTGLLPIHRFIAFLLRSTVIAMTTMWIYGNVGRSSLVNLSDIVSALIEGGSSVFTALAGDIRDYFAALGDLNQLSWLMPSGELRTILLLIGVSALASIVKSLAVKHHSILWFSGFTLLYLIILQGLAQIDTSAGVIRLLAWTAVLASWVRLEAVTMRDPNYTRRAWPVRWWMSTMAVCFGLLLGYMLWQQAYSWNKPLAWHGVEQWITQTALAEKSAENDSVSRSLTGYSEDDSKLGGPVQDDERILFHAITPEPTYWKIETKRIYTGSGWTKETSDNAAAAEDRIEQINGYGRLTAEITAEQDAAWSKPFTQTITLEQPLSSDHPLLFGGRPERLTMWLPSVAEGSLQEEQLPSLEYDPEMERYRYDSNSAQAVKDATSWSYSYQTRAIKQPLHLTDNRIAEQQASEVISNNDMTEAPYQAYTELPDSLPDRVRQLAHTITKDASSQQNKVELIQAYLQQHYAYTKSETVTPPRGQDFVDHFLFDQGQGYCNHFSTAMAVLLRAEGIPARWVKGFAPGEEESPGRYTIRATDAHSWVEVYYPTAGWVPYEAVPQTSLTAYAPGGSFTRPALAPLTLDQQVTENDLWTQVTEWLGYAGAAIQNGGTSMIKVWERFEQQVAAEWSYISDLQSWQGWLGTAGLPTWNAMKAQALLWWDQAPLSSTFILLLLLGIVVRMLLWLGSSIHQAWPRWKLAYFIRAQQRRHTVERGYAMGIVAWQLLERRYGARPSHMSYEQYAQEHALRLTLDEGELLRQFANDSTALLFARHHGERVQRQRFLRLCGDIIMYSRLPQAKHARQTTLFKRKPAPEMRSMKRKTSYEDHSIEV